MTYYIYILYSAIANKYYVGYTSNIVVRLENHNTQETHNTFTRKYRPWLLKAVFVVGDIEGDAIKIEKFIKKQKSKTLILKMLDENIVLDGYLANLVRVTHLHV